LRPPSSHTTGRTHRIRRFRLMVERLVPPVPSQRSYGSNCRRSRRRGSCGSAKATDRITSFPSLPRGAAWPGLALRASPALPSLDVAPTLRVSETASCIRRFGPSFAVARDTSLGVWPRRTTTASADFSMPVSPDCSADSLRRRTGRSPTVSRRVLGSGPAGFTRAMSE
jgi:hypothetical protein